VHLFVLFAYPDLHRQLKEPGKFMHSMFSPLQMSACRLHSFSSWSHLGPRQPFLHVQPLIGSQYADPMPHSHSSEQSSP